MIITFILQKRELSLQREDLALQRKEFETQNKTLKQQRFENTFFNMLQLFQKIVDSISLESYRPTRNPQKPLERATIMYNGREAIEAIYHDGHTTCLKRIIETNGISGDIDSINRSLLNHYFQYFYTILDFIDKSDLTGSRNEQKELNLKYEYAKILRSMLSRYELVVLFYHGLSLFDKNGLKLLLEKYSILANLDRNLLALSKDAKVYIKKEKCKKNPNFTLEADSYKVENCFKDYDIFITEEKREDKYFINAFGKTEEERKIPRLCVKKFKEYMAEN